MKKATIVTKTADLTLLDRLDSSFIVGIEEGITLLLNDSRNLDLAISSFTRINFDCVSNLGKNHILKYDVSNEDNINKIVVNYLTKLGYDEILFLSSTAMSFENIYEVLRFAFDSKLSLQIQDSKRLVFFCKESVKVINRLDYTKLTLLPYFNSRITLDHTSDNYKHYQMSQFSESLTTSFNERIAVLTVEEGGVLVILSK